MGTEKKNKTQRFTCGSFEKPYFNYRSALSLAEASRVAYREPSEVAEEVDGWGMGLLGEPFDAKDTQGFFAENEELMILSFRGTENNFGDWFRNLKIGFSEEHGMGDAHDGFMEGLDAVWEDDLVPHLEGVGGRKLWITGHSLGGALATLAAARIAVRLKKPELVAGVSTYGQPKLAMDAFKESFDGLFAKRYYRFVNHLDIVPRMPPTYCHVGNPPVHFAKNRTVKSGQRIKLEASFGQDLVLRSDRDYSEPLGEDEYERLVAFSMGFDSGVSAETPVSNRVALEAKSGVGKLAPFRDHNLESGYIAALEAQFEGEEK